MVGRQVAADPVDEVETGVGLAEQAAHRFVLAVAVAVAAVVAVVAPDLGLDETLDAGLGVEQRAAVDLGRTCTLALASASSSPCRLPVVPLVVKEF